MSDNSKCNASNVIFHDYLNGLADDAFLGDAICAMGMFDGVHIGHQQLISEMIDSAKAKGCPSVIITFDIDPLELFGTEKPRKLMSNEDRIEMLSSLGADMVFVEAFSKEFSQLSPTDYIENVLFSKMNPIELHIGSNFRFGAKAAGDIDVLKGEFSSRGFEVVAHELVEYDGQPICATRIRDLVESGDIELANKLLGRAFCVRAEVVKGRQEGRQLGFPTANLSPTIDYADIAGGVYVGYVNVDGKWYRSATSVGVPKTFGDIGWTIEAHILDFDGDIYGKVVESSFVKQIQQMQRFDSLDELIAAIAGYVRQARELPEL